MARERCAGCSGSGKGIDWKGTCVFCGGSGTIWVPDKIKPGPVGGYRGGSGRGGGQINSASSMEELLASLLTIAAFGYLLYYGYTQKWAGYWVLGLALAGGYFTHWLFNGPLRFLLTITKWLISLALIGLLIWFLIELWKMFS